MIIAKRTYKLRPVTTEMKVVVSTAIVLLIAAAAYLLYALAPPPETKDRLTTEDMRLLVEGPMAAVRERGLAAGEAEFERLRASEEARSGSHSVRLADLRMAFAVELYEEWVVTDERSLLRASRDHLQAAIPSYRAAFGPAHPEVAVALHSFADAEIKLNDNRSTPQAAAALREALRIRRAALGTGNRETRATEERLESIGVTVPVS